MKTKTYKKLIPSIYMQETETKYSTRTDEELETLIKKAVEATFSSEDTSERQRFINLNRVPLICQSIISISSRLQGIENNINWGIKVVIGAVIMGMLGLLFTLKG